MFNFFNKKSKPAFSEKIITSLHMFPKKVQNPQKTLKSVQKGSLKRLVEAKLKKKKDSSDEESSFSGDEKMNEVHFNFNFISLDNENEISDAVIPFNQVNSGLYANGGLHNPSNTCYLNTSLQIFFFIRCFAIVKCYLIFYLFIKLKHIL